MKKFIHFLNKTFYLPLLILVMLILAFTLDTPLNTFKGFYRILLSDSILLTDYAAIGGIGAAFFNAAVMTLLALVLVLSLRLKITGLIYSSILTITGFAFFGKNPLNCLPILLGIFIYSRIKKVNFRNLILTSLLSTGLAPIVSYTIFGFDLSYYISIPLGIVIGLISGLIISPMVSHTILFHKGYDIFNTGFALGIVSILFNGILSVCGLKSESVVIVTSEYHLTYLIFLIAYATFYFIVGIILEPKVFTHFIPLMKRSGRLPSDFIRDYGRSTVMVNISLLLYLMIIVTLIFKIEINGAIFGTIISVASFGAAGLHLYNTVFILIGAIICVYATGRDIQTSSIIIAIFFSLGLAPLSGRYTPIAGLFAGFIHLCIVPLTLSFQGGFDLYNNGFAAGFVACIMITTLEAFITED